RTTRSGAARSATASAIPPSGAESTRNPSARRLRSSIRRTGASSSTISTRSVVRLPPGDVAAQEDEQRGGERRQRVDRADPDRPHDRRPVDRHPQEPLPGLELGAEEVGVKRVEAREDPDQLDEEREHQGADDRRAAVPEE